MVREAAFALSIRNFLARRYLSCVWDAVLPRCGWAEMSCNPSMPLTVFTAVFQMMRSSFGM